MPNKASVSHERLASKSMKRRKIRKRKSKIVANLRPGSFQILTRVRTGVILWCNDLSRPDFGSEPLPEQVAF